MTERKGLGTPIFPKNLDKELEFALQDYFGRIENDIDYIETAPTSYFGDRNTDGSWRITVSGNDLSIERRESGAWVQKGVYNP